MSDTQENPNLYRFQNIDMILEQLEIATKALATQIQEERAERSPSARLTESEQNLFISLRTNGFRDLATPEDSIRDVRRHFKKRRAEMCHGITDKDDLKVLQGVFDAVQTVIDYTPGDRDLTVREEKILGYLILGAMNSHIPTAKAGVTAMLGFSPVSLDPILNRIADSINQPSDLLRPEYYSEEIMNQSKSSISDALRMNAIGWGANITTDLLLSGTGPHLGRKILGPILLKHMPNAHPAVPALTAITIGAFAAGLITFPLRGKRKAMWAEREQLNAAKDTLDKLPEAITAFESSMSFSEPEEGAAMYNPAIDPILPDEAEEQPGAGFDSRQPWPDAWRDTPLPSSETTHADGTEPTGTATKLERLKTRRPTAKTAKERAEEKNANGGVTPW